jgi:hypothetical protein
VKRNEAEKDEIIRERNRTHAKATRQRKKIFNEILQSLYSLKGQASILTGSDAAIHSLAHELSSGNESAENSISPILKKSKLSSRESARSSHCEARSFRNPPPIKLKTRSSRLLKRQKPNETGSIKVTVSPPSSPNIICPSNEINLSNKMYNNASNYSIEQSMSLSTTVESSERSATEDCDNDRDYVFLESVVLSFRYPVSVLLVLNLPF